MRIRRRIPHHLWTPFPVGDGVAASSGSVRPWSGRCGRRHARRHPPSRRHSRGLHSARRRRARWRRGRRPARPGGAADTPGAIGRKPAPPRGGGDGRSSRGVPRRWCCSPSPPRSPRLPRRRRKRRWCPIPARLYVAPDRLYARRSHSRPEPTSTAMCSRALAYTSGIQWTHRTFGFGYSLSEATAIIPLTRHAVLPILGTRRTA